MLWENRFRVAAAAVVFLIAALVLRLGDGPSVFERAVSLVTSRAGSVSANTLLPYGNTEKLKREAAEARVRAAELERENVLLREDIRRRGFEAAAGGKRKGIVARVTGRVPGTWNRSVTTGAGSSSGIGEGHVATTGRGLAGIVTGCGASMCTVRLLTDPSSAVSCMIVKKDPAAAPAFCIAYGNGGGLLNVVIVSGDAAGVPGDAVVTSGYGKFPRGLAIGVIRGKTRSRNFPAEGLEVEPAANFNDMDFLLVWMP